MPKLNLVVDDWTIKNLNLEKPDTQTKESFANYILHKGLLSYILGDMPHMKEKGK